MEVHKTASFNKLLTTNIDLAFKLIGDLAEDITLKPIDSTTFDFSTSTTTKTSGTEKTVKGVINKTYNSTGPNPQVLTEIIIKSNNLTIDEIDTYDQVRLRSKDFNIIKAEDNGYIVTLTVSKGGE